MRTALSFLNSLKGRALILLLALSLGGAAYPLVASAQAVRVTDQRGKVIELPAPAKRIVTIPIPLAAMVMALDGSSDRIVAMHPASRQSIEEGFLKKVFPEALAIRTDVTRGGKFNPNVESILELRPDVVIQWTQPQDLTQTLEDAGLTVVGLVSSPPTQEINEANMTIVGELIGKSDRVERLKEDNQAVQKTIKPVTDALSDNERVKAMYFGSVRQSLKPAGNNVYQDYWIRLAGGRNVAGESLKGLNNSVNVEQIAAWNPSVIFIGNFDDGVPADFLDNPALAGVDAVKNRRVYKVPHGGYRWSPGNHESRLQWEWAAMLMHPDRFDFDLRKDMRSLYKFLYNYDLDDAEIDDILHMKLNGDMAGYEHFKKH